MDAAEWPLVVFTLMIQTAAGLLIVSQLAARAGDAAPGKLLLRRDVLAFLLGALAMLVSLGHLGNPWHSPFTILNLGTSWLSREIFCTGLFVGLLALLAMTHRSRALSPFAPIIGAVACLVGLATVFVMARVYMIVTVPAWNSPATLLNFFGTTLLLGALVTGLLVCLDQGDGPAALKRHVVPILLCVVVGLGLKAVEIPLDLVAGGQPNARGISGISAMLADGGRLLALRTVLPVLGAALFGWAAVGAFRREANGLSATASTGALLLATVGEVIGRFFFYSMHALIGL
jgi:anaerobic dimethyl sulfoxide reductase subunit C (anchor subunit)